MCTNNNIQEDRACLTLYGYHSTGLDEMPVISNLACRAWALAPQAHRAGLVRTMAGHNKWSKIRHAKGDADKKRAAQFSKLSIEMSAASKACGGDLANIRLDGAIARARAANMPKHAIERAIAKGRDGKGGDDMVEYLYHGSSAGSAAVIVRCLSDNKNRTAANVRHHFSKHGGGLGVTGSQDWCFERRGLVGVGLPDGEGAAEALMEAVLDFAEDVEVEENDEAAGGGDDNGGVEGSHVATVLCVPADLHACRLAVVDAGYEPKLCEIRALPTQFQTLGAEDMERLEKLLDVFDDDDDVQDVYHNAIPTQDDAAAE